MDDSAASAVRRIFSADGDLDRQRDALAALLELVGVALHDYAIGTVDSVFRSLAAHAASAERVVSGRDAAIPAPIDAAWGVAELLRSYLTQGPHPIDEIARWDHDGLEARVLEAADSSPGRRDDLAHSIGAVPEAIEPIVTRLGELGLLDVTPSRGLSYVALSDKGRRAAVWLRRARADRAAAASSDQGAGWRSSVESLLQGAREGHLPDPTSAETLRQRFHRAFDQAVLEADWAAPPRSPRDLTADLERKLSLLLMAQLDFRMIRHPTLIERERRIAEGSIVWVIGVDTPNGSKFKEVVRANILDRGCRYVYICPRDDFARLWEGLPEVGQRELEDRLVCLSTLPIGIGRLYNVTNVDADPCEGWWVQPVGERSSIAKRQSFYSYMDPEHLGELRQRVGHIESELFSRASEITGSGTPLVVPLTEFYPPA